MKKLSEKKNILVILTIVLISCLFATRVSASSVVNLTANTTAGQNLTAGNTVQEITQVSTPTFKQVNETVYATSSVSLKSSYSQTSSNVTTLAKDQSITRTGISEETGWSRVVTANNTIAYVQSSYLTTTAPTTTTTTSLTSNTTPTTNNNTSTYKNNTNTNNTNSSLPQTGLEDNTAMIVMMIACVGIALFAYKKIRDYNV